MSAEELAAAIERAMKKRDHPSSDTLGFTTLAIADFDTIMKALSDHPPQPDAPGWRDIATAPRDGGDILLTYDDGCSSNEGAGK